MTPPTIGPTRSLPGAPALSGALGVLVELALGEVCELSLLVCDEDVVVVEVEELVVDEDLEDLDKDLVPVTNTETVG